MKTCNCGNQNCTTCKSASLMREQRKCFCGVCYDCRYHINLHQMKNMKVCRTQQQAIDSLENRMIEAIHGMDSRRLNALVKERDQLIQSN